MTVGNTSRMQYRYDNANEGRPTIEIADYPVFSRYLSTEVGHWFLCETILRTARYVKAGIPLAVPWEGAVGNSMYSTITNNDVRIGNIDDNYCPDESAEAVFDCVPLDNFIKIVAKWKDILQSCDNRMYHDAADPLVGENLMAPVIERHKDHLVLSDGTNRFLLDKFDCYWEMKYTTCEQCADVGDMLTFKVVRQKQDGEYWVSTAATRMEDHPLLEPNLKTGAVWRGTIAQVKKPSSRRSLWVVDLFPGCWGIMPMERQNLGIGDNVLGQITGQTSRRFPSASGQNFCEEHEMRYVPESELPPCGVVNTVSSKMLAEWR